MLLQDEVPVSSNNFAAVDNIHIHKALSTHFCYSNHKIPEIQWKIKWEKQTRKCSEFCKLVWTIETQRDRQRPYGWTTQATPVKPKSVIKWRWNLPVQEIWHFQPIVCLKHITTEMPQQAQLVAAGSSRTAFAGWPALLRDEAYTNECWCSIGHSNSWLLRTAIDPEILKKFHHQVSFMDFWL